VSAPPTAVERERWRQADAAARPRRLAALRDRMREAGVDALYVLRPEHSRYLTGFELGDGEEGVTGASGRFFVSADEVVLLADSRYRLQAAEQCPGSRIEDVTGDPAERLPAIVAGLRSLAGDAGVRRLAVEADVISHDGWGRLTEALPTVELVPAGDWLREQRAVKESAELERTAAACAVADAALVGLLPLVQPGASERDLALELEWRMRTGGADAVAFPVTCLSGPRAALPHGSPGERRLAEGEVVLFDFGAQVGGYRSDMTRTLFVGEPSARDLGLYGIVARAQRAALDLLGAAVEDPSGERPSPTNRQVDAVARAVIAEAGYGGAFGHGLGHGIGLATHEAPSLGRTAPERPLPAPTVFSVEPGIYLDGLTGIRIEDLVVFDPGASRLERLTRFPSEVVVVGR
jgi:Xaa-Pro aminopeptidase